jgi:hypothetical protein
MVSVMNRQRTRIRARYYRCPGAPARPPTADRRSRRAARVAGLAADMLPGALLVFLGSALIAAGIDLHLLPGI